ncbi:MAG: hypothetical protein LIO79_06055 [Rikenellaceae bacterium]|nr:hypothetical protein [Rikenellaceae bacterium]
MSIIEIENDRKIDSTDNNGYAEGVRDENLWPQDGWDSEIPLDQEIDDYFYDAENTPVYNENGYENITK